ncbi:MAG: succinylglutamate desuccinylase/aspartoacylase family protein [Planctomycetes bacterium]|nr:succinylglutamate desuccinylase/aspartoacylase family protein [Planctomycetota bacterium]
MNAAVLELPTVRRELGVWDCGRPGPTLLVIAGMHGNEPAGVLAARRVLERLQADELAIGGRLMAYAGNLAALTAGQRYLERDLNRGWGAAALATLVGAEGALAAEDYEQRELLRCFERAIATASGPVVVVDLHTSSADGPPFLCLADTIDNRRFGLATGVPVILGIEETIDGASLEWFADRGIVGVAVEGGQHELPQTIDLLESVIWRALEFLRMLPAGTDISTHRRHLQQACAGAPSVIEIVRRHAITAEDGFVMQPGFANFHRVGKGTLLARDRGGEITAPRDCIVMLPLYQKLGDDGFFLARTVRPFWLHLASVVRRLRLDACVTLMPGVRRDPEDDRTILVDRRIARWFVTEIFHLLGFRKRRQRGERLAFTRRWSRRENARLRGR